jgi:segregation and condensation protein B
VEGLIFVSDGPLSLEKISSVFDGLKPKEEILEAVNELARDYEESDRAFVLAEVGGGWQFRTRPELAQYALKLKKKSPAKLSKAAMDTLAVIAYLQPILRAEVEKIRGVEAGGVIRSLLEKDLIRLHSRRDDLPGRPMLYGTTDRFLETFGLSAISDLPSIEDMSKIGPPEGKQSRKLF